jgi:predicted transport protein
MPLYQIDQNKIVSQIKPASFSKERELQKLFESNMDVLMGVRFIASEVTTGDRQRGRIDSLGIDQDGYPTIIEYKRSNKDNVINQGLFYLDWLVDHKGDFTIAAQRACGMDVKIDWSHPRLILIAESFSDYDKYAVNRIGANVELWTFRLYGEDLLFLEPLFVTQTKSPKAEIKVVVPEIQKTDQVELELKAELPAYTVEDHLTGKPPAVVELFEVLRERIFALSEGDTITEKANKMYIGYKHGKNFAEVRLQSKLLQIWLDISAEELEDPYQLARDVENIGHYGTGDVEVRLSDLKDLDKVMALVEQSYKQTV